jgi:hypothetical protein
MNSRRNASIPLAGVAGAVGLTAAFMVRKGFAQKLDALDQRLSDAQGVTKARTDLPPEVTELAKRLGASSEHPTRYVDMRQSGTMWFKPGGSPRRFTARQRTGTSSSGFVWRAKIGPIGAVSVVDAFVSGRGFLEARLFGVLRVAEMDGTPSANQGEALRYLAELPLNPDAILFDHALLWTVDDPHTITVVTGAGASRAEIVFALDDAGLITTASAASRTFGQTGKSYPWRGRFWDYQMASGRCIPMQAEVAWVIDGKDFIYWRGKLESWSPATFAMLAK